MQLCILCTFRTSEGSPSPRNTTLAPRDWGGPITLQVGRGIAWVRYVPRDDCGFSATAGNTETREIFTIDPGQEEAVGRLGALFS